MVRNWEVCPLELEEIHLQRDWRMLTRGPKMDVKDPNKCEQFRIVFNCKFNEPCNYFRVLFSKHERQRISGHLEVG